MVKSTQAAQADTAPSAALEFCLRLARAYAVVTRRLDNVLGSIHGLSFGDFMVLYHLQRAPGMRLRRIDLAERLGLTASGVTRTLLPLEKLGLVTRQADARDARVGYAVLTKPGQRRLTDAMASAESISREAMQAVVADQIDAASAVLGLLAGINLSNA